MQQLWHEVINPHYCVVCGAPTRAGGDFCAACYQELPWLGNCCRQCAEPLPGGVTLCGSCLRSSREYLKFFVPFRYDFPINSFIQRLKFGEDLHSARVLGELVYTFLQQQYQDQDWPEVLIPVPLPWVRLRQRGYNQVFEIARYWQHRAQIPLLINGIERYLTPPQATLNRQQRLKNLQHAFKIVTPLPYRHVALIDDVVTTGSTIAALSKVLRQAGVQKIDVWCCARTVRD